VVKRAPVLSRRFSPPTAQRVVVVGASAAGLYTATRIAQRGFPVTVLESAPHIDPSARSLICTSELLDIVGDAAADCVVAETTRFELVAGERTTVVPLAQPDLIIERARLVDGLARQATLTGAEILTGHRFVGFAEEDPLRVMVAAPDDTVRAIEASHVIGADGAFSQVAKAAGWAPRPCAPLIQAIVPWPAALSPQSTRVWFVTGDTPYFYWLIPDGPNRGALGVIGEDGARTRRGLERFLEREGLTPLEYQAARIPIYTGWRPVSRRVRGGMVHLVGDAAGHVKVSTVGGIVTGFKGANAVVHAVAGGDPLALSRARIELDVHLLIRRALHGFDVGDYVRLVDSLNVAARRTLGRITRDNAASLAFRLLVDQPQLAWIGLRSLYSSSAGLDRHHARPLRPDIGPDPLLPS
jgi:flavin-dependent dehydrogenase